VGGGKLLLTPIQVSNERRKTVEKREDIGTELGPLEIGGEGGRDGSRLLVPRIPSKGRKGGKRVKQEKKKRGSQENGDQSYCTCKFCDTALGAQEGRNRMGEEGDDIQKGGVRG